MLTTTKTDYYLQQINQIVSDIRAWPDWHREELQMMRNHRASLAQGWLVLHLYALYVKRFTHIICDVLSKVPYYDDRFWRLAVNLYDELGNSDGLSKAHGKLLDNMRNKPDFLADEAWTELTRPILQLEQEMVGYFQSLQWPLNLFALGPGTESISDLFLEPIEIWSAEAIAPDPDVKLYFDVHRPEVECEHQLAIAKILAEELTLTDDEEHKSVLKMGTSIAEKIANYHLQATIFCFKSGII